MDRREYAKSVTVLSVVPFAGCLNQVPGFGSSEKPEVSVDVQHLGENDYAIEAYVEIKDAESVDFIYKSNREMRVVTDTEEVSGDKYEPITVATVEGGGTLKVIANMDGGSENVLEQEIG